MNKAISKYIVFLILLDCKNINVGNQIIISLEKEIIIPKKSNSATCKYGFNIWTIIENKSNDSIYFYQPEMVFWEEKNNSYTISNEFLNQIPISCPIFVESDRMKKWFKVQKYSSKLSELLLDEKLRHKNLKINRRLIGDFIFMRPHETVIYPYLIGNNLVYKTQVHVKSNPNRLQQLGATYDYKKLGKLPRIFNGHKYYLKKFESATIQLDTLK